MKTKAKILGLILLVSQSVSADVDLRSRFGPVLDKGNVGWCYGYTAADLLGHWLNAKYPQLMNGHRVSASGVILSHLTPRRTGEVASMRGVVEAHRGYRAEVATAEARVRALESQPNMTVELQQARAALAQAQAKLNRTDANRMGVTERDADEGGKAREAIIQVMQSGSVCYDSSLTSEPLRVPEAAADMQRLGMNEYSVAQLGRVLRRFISGADTSTYGAFQNLLSRVFTRYDFNQNSMAELLASEDPMGELHRAQCTDVDLNVVEEPTFTEMNGADSSAEEMLEFARATLDLGRPVELGFDSRILNHPGGHSVTLVGYRTANGQIEFLLRNMWGAQSCATDLAQMADPGFTCTADGHYLIPASVIATSIGSVMRIENY